MLLNHHRSISRKLLLQHRLPSREYWREVFTKLQGSAVRDVKVYHVSRGVDLDPFFRKHGGTSFRSDTVLALAP